MPGIGMLLLDSAAWRRLLWTAVGTIAVVVVGLVLVHPAPAAAATGSPSVSASDALPPSAAELLSVEGGEAAEEGAEPAVCGGCTPPLTYHGGVVMGTPTQAGKITITPIYWVPAGFTMDPAYKSLINQYITDVASDSGTGKNVFAINAEYSRATSPAGGDQMKYAITAGTPITDTTAYPGGGCTPDQGYTACVTDGQLRTRLSALLQANALPADLAHIYPVFFPGSVDFADSSGHHKDSTFCAYHGAYTSTVPAGPVIYGVEPFSDVCEEGQFPNWGLTHDNGVIPADAAVSILSHEINEAITDPQLDFSYGWYDSSGHEIGDECAETHGPPLGSTDTSDATQKGQTAYNQVINGHRYYTQTSFSNATFAKFGMGQGCVGKAFQPQGAAEPTVPVADIINAHVNASPNKLPADGTSTSTITVSVTTNSGAPVEGDSVAFNVATAEGEEGLCGELTDSGGSALTDGGLTDANGEVTVTYTASTEDATCSIYATDYESGTPAVANISQGADAQDNPFVTGDIPTALAAGGDPIPFEIDSVNPGDDEVPNTRLSVYLFGDNTATAGLKASQVQLSYSDDTTGGQFVAMPLAGTTVNDGFISGFVLPAQGNTLPGQSFRTTRFQLTLTPDAPNTAATGSPLHIEVDLDGINPADGSATNLEYIDPSTTSVAAGQQVTPPAAPTSTVTVVLIPAPAVPAVGCKVPKLKGKSLKSAKKKLKSAGCAILTIVRPTGKTPKHKKLVVRRVQPKAGKRVKATGTVTITMGFVKKK